MTAVFNFVVRCEYPHIQNGRLYHNEWEGSFPKRLGYRLDFICNNGFLAKSKDSWHSSYCTIRGWNPEPKCFKKCDRPQQIQHGAFNYHRLSIYIEGDDITLSCDTGYYPANQQTKIMCTKNGWSPTPSCVSPGKQTNLIEGAHPHSPRWDSNLATFRSATQPSSHLVHYAIWGLQRSD
uniref:Sushi domain-containing protein n=1 Tax=Anolis carolinensis TaxID=28377 RepID=A0A803T338_ANOCA